MATKFSAFTAEADINNFEGLVGYTTALGGLNYKIEPLEMPARKSGTNVALGDALTLTGTGIAAAGERNTAVGADAMPIIGTLTDSVALGYQTLYRIVDLGAGGTGQQVAVGAFAQFANGDAILGSGISGDENVAVGYEALYTNTGDDGAGVYLGAYNVAVGTDSLFLLDTGDTNTAVGHNSGSGLTNGYGNTIIGFEAGLRPATVPLPNFSMTTESNAVVIGNRAATQGSNSVTIGDFAYGETGISAPDFSVVIGYESSVNAPASVLIGSSSTIDSQSERDVVVGRGTTLTTVNGLSTIVGSDTTITGDYNTHVGWLGNLEGDDNCSVGNSQDIYGNDNVAVGDTTSIGSPGAFTASYCVALGAGITIGALTSNVYVIGAGATGGVQNSLSVGFGGTGAAGSATTDIYLVGRTGGATVDSYINLANGSKLDISVDLVKYDGQVALAYADQGNVAVNQTPDWNDGNIQKFTLDANININDPVLATIQPGTYTLILEQGVGAPYNVASWGAAYKWPAATGAPTLSTGAGQVDIITFVCDGTNLYGTYTNNFT